MSQGRAALEWANAGSCHILLLATEILETVDKCADQVPPTGFEPVLLAPEASTLSTELRGHFDTVLYIP